MNKTIEKADIEKELNKLAYKSEALKTKLKNLNKKPPMPKDLLKQLKAEHKELSKSVKKTINLNIDLEFKIDWNFNDHVSEKEQYYLGSEIYCLNEGEFFTESSQCDKIYNSLCKNKELLQAKKDFDYKISPFIKKMREYEKIYGMIIL